jgi:hypothetical protein
MIASVSVARHTSYKQAANKQQVSELCTRIRTAVISLVLPLLCFPCRSKMSLFMNRSDESLPLAALCQQCKRKMMNSTRKISELGVRGAKKGESKKWCRYCGTDKSTTWFDGPHGIRTLRSSHNPSVFPLDPIKFKSVQDSPAFCHNCWKPSVDSKTSRCPSSFDRACEEEKGKSFKQAEYRKISRQVGNPDFSSSLNTNLPHSFTRAETKSEEVGIPSDPQSPQPVSKRSRRTSCSPSKVAGNGTMKKRWSSLSNSGSDFLICTESFIVPQIPKPPTIQIPSFRLVDPHRHAVVGASDWRDEMLGVYEKRHLKYEETEKHVRILRPGVFQSLVGKA